MFPDHPLPPGTQLHFPVRSPIRCETNVQIAMYTINDCFNQIKHSLDIPLAFHLKTRDLSTGPATAEDTHNAKRIKLSPKKLSPPKGRPYTYICHNESAITFIELKGPWILTRQSTEEFIARWKGASGMVTDALDRIRKHDILKTIGQVYGYLAYNGFRYGVLSSFETSYFFLSRQTNGELMISDAVYFDSTGPTLMHCLYYCAIQAMISSPEQTPSPTMPEEKECFSDGNEPDQLYPDLLDDSTFVSQCTSLTRSFLSTVAQLH